MQNKSFVQPISTVAATSMNCVDQASSLDLSGPNGGDSGIDKSLPSSAGSVSTNTTGATTTTAAELEKKFQQALSFQTDAQSHVVDDSEVDQVTQPELDALYAKDMFALTGAERDEALKDIHGVTDTIVETSEFVDQHCQLLQQELSLLVSRPRQKTMAYQEALRQDAEYIGSRGFQLLFLRADRWKPREAAVRLVAFFETKKELFGSALLTKQITVADFSKDDQKSLESGFFQLLPVRDAGGRAILCGIPMLRQYKTIDNLKRTFYYMIMTALEDEDTQKSGLVMVGYNMGPRRVIDRKAAFAIQSLRRHLPFHLNSIHYCYDDFRCLPMMTVAMLVMGAMTRVRFRAHYGCIKDVLNRLSTFGIPWPALPISGDGEPKTRAHRNWLKSRRSQEYESQSTGLIVVVPRRLDILLGRGKPIQEHWGNLRYQLLVDFYQDTYERAKKFQKMKICQHILASVAEYGGRFLRQEGAGWIEVDEIVAREKTAHAFRTRRDGVGNGGPVNLTTSSTNSTTTITDRNKRNFNDMTNANSKQAPSILGPTEGSDGLKNDEVRVDDGFHGSSKDCMQPDKRLRQ